MVWVHRISLLLFFGNVFKIFMLSLLDQCLFNLKCSFFSNILFMIYMPVSVDKLDWMQKGAKGIWSRISSSVINEFSSLDRLVHPSSNFQIQIFTGSWWWCQLSHKMSVDFSVDVHKRLPFKINWPLFKFVEIWRCVGIKWIKRTLQRSVCYRKME